MKQIINVMAEYTEHERLHYTDNLNINFLDNIKQKG